MSWKKEEFTKHGNKWTIPKEEVVIHEETIDVETLNIYPEDLSLPPREVQDGFEHWTLQSVNLKSEWSEETFYPQKHLWQNQTFYPKLVWSNQEFYPKRHLWGKSPFYPQGFLWKDFTSTSRILSPSFYPKPGKWNLDEFYPQNFKWRDQEFYPKNFIGIWEEIEFYPKSSKWDIESI